MMTPQEKAHFLSNRAGKLTASRMAEAMDFKKDGKPSAARTQLQFDLLAERATGDTVRTFVTKAMEDGILFEDDAKEAYELATGSILLPAPTVDHPSIEYFAATPDAYLDDGLAEFKVPTAANFLRWKLAGVVPDQHKPQMCAQCLCTGRRWVEFVAYSPRIKDRRQRLLIVRYTPSEEELRAVENEAARFLAEVAQMWEQFTAREVA